MNLTTNQIFSLHFLLFFFNGEIILQNWVYNPSKLLLDIGFFGVFHELGKRQDGRNLHKRGLPSMGLRCSMEAGSPSLVHGRVAGGVEEGGGGSLPLSPLPPGLLAARDPGGLSMGGGPGRGGAAPERSAEPLTEPGRHGVVEDGVDGGVDVEHQAGEVEQVVIHLGIEVIHDLIWGYYYPHGQHLEG